MTLARVGSGAGPDLDRLEAIGKLAGERIYWDQASVLVQLGLLHASVLPVAGVETARKVLDQTIPSNQLIERANRGE